MTALAATSSRPASIRATLLGLIAAGFAARLALWLASWGANDADLWQAFATLIHRDGLIQTYRTQPLFNHPPLMPYWAAAAEALSRATGVSFPVLFKLPMLLADGLTCWLLWQIGRGDRSLAGLSLAAIYATAPIAILITAHHCNTEPVYVALSLLAAWLLADRGRAGLAGLALGAAINVKLVPILLVPVLAACCRRRDELARFAGALAAMAVPALVVLVMAPRAYWTNVVAYSSDLAHWGLGYFLLEASGEPAINPRVEAMLASWRAWGKYAILAAAATVAVAQWRWRRWTAYEASLLAMGAFLVLAPGFGLQYLVAPLALLAIARPAAAVGYGALAGAFATCWYLLVWDGTVPIRTTFVQIHPLPGRLFGGLTWAVLVVALVKVAACPTSQAADAHRCT